MSGKFMQVREIRGKVGSMNGDDDRSDAEKNLIAEAIKRHLQAKGISRKKLEREDLHISTIDKALSGHFSEATLVKLEAILETPFRSQEHSAGDDAPEELGGYSFRAVNHLQGDYLFLRCVFSNPTIIFAYVIEIRWDKSRPCLIFKERSRADAKHAQGCVYIPFGKPFMKLITISHGSIRSIITSLPDEYEPGKGIITSLHNPRGAMFVPAVSPAALRRIETDAPVLGLINPGDPNYDEYRDLLASIVAEQYGLFVPSPLFAGRRGIATIVGS
jgi:hypothetical protein